MLPKYLFVFALVVTLLLVGGSAQNGAAQDSQSAKSSEADAVTVPSGTKVMLALIHPISTKSARAGDEIQILVYNFFATLDTAGDDDVTVTVTNLPAALAEIVRLLRPEGVLTAVIPCEGGRARRVNRRGVDHSRPAALPRARSALEYAVVGAVAAGARSVLGDAVAPSLARWADAQAARSAVAARPNGTRACALGPPAKPSGFPRTGILTLERL